MTRKNQLENQPIRMGAWDDLVCGLDIGLGCGAWLKKPLGGLLRLGSDGWGQPVIPERGLCFSKALLRAVGSIRIWSGKCPHTAFDFRPPSATNVALQYPPHPHTHPPIKIFSADLPPNNILYTSSLFIPTSNFLSLTYHDIIDS